MIEREQLNHAIHSLEAQRDTLGDAVVDTTVSALREKLVELDHSTAELTLPRPAQRKQVTILFANITGFSGMAEGMPDTNILNIMNILWRRLDRAITEQNGTIDKHTGDGVMGLFGVPVAREDDPERAIRAALIMRAALSNFVSEMSGQEGIDDDLLQNIKDIRIRIGINTGPVMLGEVGTSEEYTVIGDAVNIASRLERVATPGGILIAHDTYMLVRDIFNVEPLGPMPIKGRSEPIQVYLVLGIKPRLFYESGRGVEGVETRMIGRDAELQQLQQALQTAVKNRVGQVVTVVGEAGVGKSRLLHEFSNWIRSLPYDVPVFKGRTNQQVQPLPYTLIRDLFSSYFGILDNDPASVVEEKLVEGMNQFMGQEDEEVRKQAHIIGQLIGLELSDGFQYAANVVESPQLRERAYEIVANFFEIITANFPAVLIFAEDLHWADEGSMELLGQLGQVSHQAPLILVSVTRSLKLPQMSFTQAGLVMTLKTLSKNKSHQLVLEILQKLSNIPSDLADLIVSRGEGNPFYVEELIKILIEDGVIIAGEKEWQLRRNQLPEVRIPPHITGVLQSRLDRLSALERATLQRAAVVGRIFWDSVVMVMNEAAPEPLNAAQTMTALQALEKRELIFRRRTSGFAGTQEYVFKHSLLQKITYESVLLRTRPTYHKQVADWLAEQSGERVSEYAGLIAEHYELASEKSQAAGLYEMAAARAMDTYNVDTAIDYYRQALFLLAEKSHHGVWQLRLQELLGKLLRSQARFVEAAQTYMTMRFTAEEDGDLALQALAWNGLAGIQREQANFTDMLESAIQAEQVAWLVNAESILVQSLLLKGEAFMRLGDLDQALTSIWRAQEINERLNEPETVPQCLFWLGEVAIRRGRYDEAEHCLEQLKQHLTLMEYLEETPVIALTRLLLGKFYNRLGQYHLASRQIVAALTLYHELDAQYGAGQALHELGEAFRLQGNVQRAIPQYRRAISIANGVSDIYAGLIYRTHLSAALIELGSFPVAARALRQVIRLAEDASKMAGWLYLPLAYTTMARIYLGEGKRKKALRLGQQAYQQAVQQGSDEQLGLAWRVLGRVMSQLPPDQIPVQIGDADYDTAACFAESLRLFEAANGGGVASHWQQAQTLAAWAAFETANGTADQGQKLRARAQKLADGLGLSLANE